MSVRRMKPSLRPATGFTRRSATYFRAQDAGEGGEANYTVCLYTGGTLDETIVVSSSALASELSVLRKQGYEVTRADA